MASELKMPDRPILCLEFRDDVKEFDEYVSACESLLRQQAAELEQMKAQLQEREQTIADDEVSELRKLAEEAAKGEWCKDYCYSAIRHVHRNCDIECGTHGEDCPGAFNRYDGPYIAYANPERILRLCAALSSKSGGEQTSGWVSVETEPKPTDDEVGSAMEILADDFRASELAQLLAYKRVYLSTRASSQLTPNSPSETPDQEEGK